MKDLYCKVKNEACEETIMPEHKKQAYLDATSCYNSPTDTRIQPEGTCTSVSQSAKERYSELTKNY